MYVVAIVVKPSSVAMSAVIPPCRASDTFVRNTKSLSSNAVSAGEDDAGEIWTMPFWMVADLATESDTPDDIAPMMPTAPSTFIRALAASAPSCSLVPESRWITSICLPFTPPAAFTALIATSMAAVMSGPKTPKSPVLGTTDPIVTVPLDSVGCAGTDVAVGDSGASVARSGAGVDVGGCVGVGSSPPHDTTKSATATDAVTASVRADNMRRK